MVKKRRQGDPSDTDSTSDENFKSDKDDSSSKCKHAKRAVNLQNLRKLFKKSKKSTFDYEKCSECEKTSNDDANAGDYEYDRSLWLCLKCGTHLCGRTVNKHALKHYEVCTSMRISRFSLLFAQFTLNDILFADTKIRFARNNIEYNNVSAVIFNKTFNKTKNWLLNFL